MATVTKSIGTALGSAGNGVVTLTSGSTSVTGSGTDFTSKFTGGTAPPQAVEIPIGGGTYYTVKSVESDTALTLVSDPGVSASSQSWKVGTRDYSTIDAWDADLDNTAIYSSSDTGRGECYADSAFTQSGYQRLEGGITIGLSIIILTVPVGQRHDGTADSGAKVNLTNGGRFVLWYKSNVGGPPRTMEWLELDGGDSSQSFGAASFIVGVSTAGYQGTVSHLLIHGAHNSRVGNGFMQGIIAGKVSHPAGIFDNIIYDCSGVLLTPGISSSNKGIICNNTVYKIGMSSTSGEGVDQLPIGILCGTNCVIKNNISIGTYRANDVSSAYDYRLDTNSTSVGTYNLSGDSTASGSNSITGVTAASLFISTTSGSEDLHILRSSSAVGAGEDLGTSVTSDGFTFGSSTYGAEINRDINNGNRDAFSQTWDIGASQFQIIAKIGTSSRDFSTIGAWEADLDDADYYGKGSYARGECYNDTTFEISSNPGVNMNGGGTVGLSSRTLSAAVGQRHDGTANSGVRVLCTNTGGNVELLVMNLGVGSAGGTGNQIEWIELDCNGGPILAGIRLYDYSGAQNCIVHGARWCKSNNETVGIKAYSKNTWTCNNIVYDIECDAGSSSSWGTSGIRIQKNDWGVVTNNTVYGTKTNASVGLTYADGIHVTYGGQYQRVYNNISMGTDSDNGTATDFDTLTSTLYTDANYSSDTSAPGDTNYRSESAADTFVSIGTGSEDFHLKDGSNALRAGKDAGTHANVGHDDRRMPYSPYIWSVDINGRDRDSEGDDWDIGAHQCEDCSEGGAVTNTAFMFFVD